jgi:hypothetical protein
LTIQRCLSGCRQEAKWFWSSTSARSGRTGFQYASLLIGLIGFWRYYKQRVIHGNGINNVECGRISDNREYFFMSSSSSTKQRPSCSVDVDSCPHLMLYALKHHYFPSCKRVRKICVFPSPLEVLSILWSFQFIPSHFLSTNLPDRLITTQLPRR